MTSVEDCTSSSGTLATPAASYLIKDTAFLDRLRENMKEFTRQLYAIFAELSKAPSSFFVTEEAVLTIPELRQGDNVSRSSYLMSKPDIYAPMPIKVSATNPETGEKVERRAVAYTDGDIKLLAVLLVPEEAIVEPK